MASLPRQRVPPTGGDIGAPGGPHHCEGRGGGRGEDEGVRWRSQWGCEGVRVCDMGGEGPSLPLSLRASWCSR